MTPLALSRRAVQADLEATPLIGVVRTDDPREAEAQAEALMAAGVPLIEITFTVPGAPDLVSRLVNRGREEGPPWIGMGTVTTSERASRAVKAGAAFIVSPNAAPGVADAATAEDLFLVLGALTPTEIVAAHGMGADLVKVYPLPPVGGARYLSTVRQPLEDVPMLAAGGFPVREIPEYRRAGAVAFGLPAAFLLSDGAGDPAAEAIRMARGLDRP